ncbi:CLUMA_CG000495, isoform A [Clunio marinus]|uniref:CLUMA_CG000495, isoform A n=1 Tax=Clunio marinus TaxID=568069 RepID=A0A1J1HFN0_9DIPT|nr:CLUMA_CG000495, isoform A [Clunio marinus]
MNVSFKNQSNYETKSQNFVNTTNAVETCLKQFDEFTNSLNEVCNQASLLSRSLKSLEEFVMPEIIGRENVEKMPSSNFKSSEHLMDSLVTFSKIMMSFSERIKCEALDSFDDFIVQAVLPRDDEVKGILEHNRQIIHEFYESFFSVQNHYLILSAELLEKFLICNDCSIPIGFPHKPKCLTKSMSKPIVWKKIKFDDKFITFGMKFSFDDFVAPGSKKNILTQIASSCLKRQNRNVGHEKTSMLLTTKSFPRRWVRSDKSKSSDKNKLPRSKAVCIARPSPPIFKPSIWTPNQNDSSNLSKVDYEIIGFAFDPNGRSLDLCLPSSVLSEL